MFLLPTNLRATVLHYVPTLTGMKKNFTHKCNSGDILCRGQMWRKVRVVVKFYLEQAKNAQNGSRG
jgi:hypothetical protein